MSSSSEFTDSWSLAGARAPEKSSFLQTCNLLSQYLKENGSLRDLCLGITSDRNGMPTPMAAPGNAMNLLPVARHRHHHRHGDCSGIPPTRNEGPTMTCDLTSMDLFPQHSGFGPNIANEEVQNFGDFRVNRSAPETAQMTIFYGGQVFVFNDVFADKAKEIALLASKASSQAPNIFPSTPIQRPIETPNLVPTSSNIVGHNFGNTLMPDRIERLSSAIAADLPIARKASLARFLGKRKDRTPYQKSNSTGASPSKPVRNKSWLGLAPQSPEAADHQS